MKEPIHKIITKAFRSNNLDWLGIRMTYRCYTNISELLQSNLPKKLNKDLISLDYMERPCNCPAQCLIDNKCPYWNKCRSTCVVYKVKCKTTGKFYIGLRINPIMQELTMRESVYIRTVPQIKIWKLQYVHSFFKWKWPSYTP